MVLAPASDHSDLSALINRQRPIVAVDRSTGFAVDAVMMDNRHAGQAAANALFDAGYSRVACITGPHGIETADERSRGWRGVIEQRGVYDPSALIFANHRVDGGRAAMHELISLDVPPDAVVVTNNLMGVGALQILTEAGLMPPSIGVAVIGDLPFTTLSPSSITLVHLPARHLGVTAANMLIERINGDIQPARTVVLRNEISRATTLIPTRAS